MKVSIICVYNKSDVYQNVLMSSLENQDCSFEMFGIDNRSKVFSSAASALNYGAVRTKGELLIFVHQDVSFYKSYSLRHLIEIFNSIAEDGDIGGIVGSGFNTNMNPRIIAGSKSCFLDEVVGSKGFKEDFAYAESVDEFLLVMTRKTYIMHPFNEKVCSDWHFYGLEQCMNARLHNHKVFVINTAVKHYSPGKIDFRFYWAQLKLALNYPFFGRVIGTCCDFYSYSFFGLFLEAVKSTLKEYKNVLFKQQKR